MSTTIREKHIGVQLYNNKKPNTRKQHQIPKHIVVKYHTLSLTQSNRFDFFDCSQRDYTPLSNTIINSKPLNATLKVLINLLLRTVSLLKLCALVKDISKDCPDAGRVE